MESKSLRREFDVTGFFYKKNEYSLRKFLNIKKKSSKLNTPDLMVIMMNPGSSHPEGTTGYKDIPTELFGKLVPTVPDNTQDQIMRVMLNCGFEYSRILNLSDLCDSKSGSFYSKLNTLQTKKIDHSIFHINREADFETLFEVKATIIAAWGVNKAL